MSQKQTPNPDRPPPLSDSPPPPTSQDTPHRITTNESIRPSPPNRQRSPLAKITTTNTPASPAHNEIVFPKHADSPADPFNPTPGVVAFSRGYASTPWFTEKFQAFSRDKDTGEYTTAVIHEPHFYRYVHNHFQSNLNPKRYRRIIRQVVTPEEGYAKPNLDSRLRRLLAKELDSLGKRKWGFVRYVTSPATVDPKSNPKQEESAAAPARQRSTSLMSFDSRTLGSNSLDSGSPGFRDRATSSPPGFAPELAFELDHEHESLIVEGGDIKYNAPLPSSPSCTGQPHQKRRGHNKSQPFSLEKAKKRKPRSTSSKQFAADSPDSSSFFPLDLKSESVVLDDSHFDWGLIGADDALASLPHHTLLHDGHLYQDTCELRDTHELVESSMDRRPAPAPPLRRRVQSSQDLLCHMSDDQGDKQWKQQD